MFQCKITKEIAEDISRDFTQKILKEEEQEPDFITNTFKKIQILENDLLKMQKHNKR